MVFGVYGRCWNSESVFDCDDGGGCKGPGRQRLRGKRCAHGFGAVSGAVGKGQTSEAGLDAAGEGQTSEAGLNAAGIRHMQQKRTDRRRFKAGAELLCAA